MVFESWVNQLNVSEVPFEELEKDPDRPFDVSGKKFPTKMERTGIFNISLLQDTSSCIREKFAEYLGDHSPNGLCIATSPLLPLADSNRLLALDFVTPCCCDRCDTFDFSGYFLGDIYMGDEPKTAKVSKAPTLKNRPMKQRGPLQILLRQWRSKAHESDPLRAIRSQTWIIDDGKIRKLSIVLPNRIRIPSDIANLLGETQEWSIEWSFQIFAVVHKYDNPHLYTLPPSPTPSTTSDDEEPPAKRRKICRIQTPIPSLKIRIPSLARRRTMTDLTNTWSN